MQEFFRQFIPPAWRWCLRQQYLKLRGWWYAGQQVECPCCRGRFRKFLPMRRGDFPRQGAICPACTAMERHRMLMLFIMRDTPLPRQPMRVLYLAPEPGIQQQLSSWRHLDYVSADLSSPIAMEHFDIQHIPYSKASFDAIFCAHVLAHVLDDRRALAELYRVLRPGGTLYLLDWPDAQLPQTLEATPPLSASARALRFGQADRWRRYGRDFVARIEAAGFVVREMAFAERLSHEERKRYGIRTDERIYLCQKENEL